MSLAATKSLALNGGDKAVKSDPGDTFTWPIVTAEDETAVLEVLRRGGMSGTEVTRQFEGELADWFGTEYALCHNSGTAAILTAMFGCGVGRGDEIICQSMTYWGSALQVFNLGGTVVFGELDPHSLCLDPADIEARITPRTKAIIAVHYAGHPTDMDPLMEIAQRHGIKVIEDVSHAQGTLYKGRLTGTIGHVGAMSIMSGKSLVAGEGGFLVTNDAEIYERGVAFGHYERTPENKRPELARFAGLPLGGYKHRMHQLSSAVGRVQLKHYKERIVEIQEGMNYFWDLLEGVPGLRAHRPSGDSQSTMGGWYAAKGLYVPDELGGLPVARFCAAVRAEGSTTSPGANLLMHLHPVLNEADVFADGKPTRIAHSDRDLRQGPGSLPVTESIPGRCYGIPWFKKYRRQIIEEHALAFRKVAEHADQVGEA